MSIASQSDCRRDPGLLQACCKQVAVLVLFPPYGVSTLGRAISALFRPIRPMKLGGVVEIYPHSYTGLREQNKACTDNLYITSLSLPC